MAKRTDPHCPSNLNPENYQYLATYAYTDKLEDLDLNIEHRHAVNAHVKQHGKGYIENPSENGGCNCCGQFHNIGATFVYLPTMELVRFGHTCAEQIDMGRAPAKAEVIRIATDALKRRAGKAKAEALLTMEYGLPGMWEWFIGFDMGAEPRDFVGNKARVLARLIEGLIRYGSWTEAQQSFAGSLWDKWVGRRDDVRLEEAQRKEERDARMVDVEPGRREIEGRVVSIKSYDGYYGETVKMVVNCGTFRVFCAVPGSISTVLKGDKIAMNITLEPKERGFAYGKRPAKARIIEESTDE